MNLKKFVFLVAKVALVIVFLAWLIPNPWIFSVELEKYNPEKAAACEKLVQKMTRPEGIPFFVSHSLFLKLDRAVTFIPGRVVFFNPVSVNKENFLEIAAHELGHIEYKTTNQILADLFAMKFANKERLMDARKKDGFPSDYLHAINTCYESNGKDCPDLPTPSISYTLGQFFDDLIN